MRTLLSLLLLVTGTFAFSYPENIRHGYVNCTTCHMSPNGGGILTQYGRSLSREVISSAGLEAETRWMYFVNPPEYLHLGGNVRWLQTHKDTPTFKEGRFFLMQADLEAGVTLDKLTFIGTVGRSEMSEPKNMDEWTTSHRHYLMYKATDEITLRAGRFMPAFGILIADHTFATRRGLGFDQSKETYNFETSYIGENFDVFLNLNFGRFDKPSLKRERGGSLRSSYAINEKTKVGLGYYMGHNETRDRHLVGPFGMVALTKKLVFLQEADFIRTVPGSGTNTWGIAHFAKLDFEVLKGLHLYAYEDIIRTDFKAPDTVSNSFGAGVQFFPRPHLEFIAQYQRQKTHIIDPDNYNDYVWLQMHFYP